MALMLTQRDTTASLCRAKTHDLAQFTILAYIPVVTADCPNLIGGPMVKTGAVVTDVGINRLPDGRLVGDCDFGSASRRAAMITPVSLRREHLAAGRRCGRRTCLRRARNGLEAHAEPPQGMRNRRRRHERLKRSAGHRPQPLQSIPRSALRDDLFGCRFPRHILSQRQTGLDPARPVATAHHALRNIDDAREADRFERGD